MLSPLATLSSIVSVIIGALVIGLTGNASLASSWVMVFLLFYLQTVLVFVILRGFRAATPTGARLGPIRWRFILLHAGLLLTLASSFWGAPDGREYKVITYAGIILLLCGAFLLFLGGPTKRYRDTD